MHNHLHNHLPDTNQSAWQLAVIQLTGIISLPVLAASVLILQNNNFASAVVTLVLGNVILWVIRWGIVAMSFEGRKSTLDISRDYVGKFGSYFIAILLLASTLAWFIVQTTLASNALIYLVPIQEAGINHFIQTSVAIGILSTVVCMEGIVVIRWATTIAFPLLLIAFVGVVLTSSHDTTALDHRPFSLSGLPLVLGTSLGITADLPTFFRHSRSKQASLWAVSIIQVLSLGIGIGALFLISVIEPWFGIKQAETLATITPTAKVFLVTLILLSVICANVSNVYSASVGWEIVAPSLAGRKEYLILGLGLTIIFILISNIFSMDLLLSTTDGALVNLSLVLIIGYLISLWQKRPPTPFEQKTFFTAWLLATLIAFLLYTKVIAIKISPLLTGTIIILVIITLGHAFSALAWKRNDGKQNIE